MHILSVSISLCMVIFNVVREGGAEQSRHEITFGCKNGFVSDIHQKNNSVALINDKYCNLTDPNCEWQSKYKEIKVVYRPTPMLAQVIDRGQIFYNLKCNDLHDYYDTVKGTFTIRSYIVSPTQVTVTASTPIITLFKLEIENKDGPVSSARIGDPLNLILNSASGFKAYPYECTAYPMPDLSGTPVLLWGNKTGSCETKDPSVMGNNWTQSQNKMSVKLFGFRFVESNTITIACKIHICPESSNCTPLCILSMKGQTTTTHIVPAGQRRRKRNAESMSYGNAVPATLRIIDGDISNGGLAMSTFTYTIVMIGTLMSVLTKKNF